jgi:hypothetical protein
MRIGRQAPSQESALDVSRDLLGDVAGALLADLKLAALHSIADNALEPIEMHLREAVQRGLQGRGDGTEYRAERAAGTHALALAMNDAEHVEISL